MSSSRIGPKIFGKFLFPTRFREISGLLSEFRFSKLIKWSKIIVSIPTILVYNYVSHKLLFDMLIPP